MNRFEQLELTHALSLFGLLGFETIPIEVDKVASVKDGLILCMDDRNKLNRRFPGGAIPGAFTGLRIIMPGQTPDERAKEVIKRCRENDLIPTTHGDLSKGPLLGCAVRFALVYGTLDGFPTTSVTESQRLNSEYNIPHRILRNSHTAKKIILNFNQGTTIEPHGEYFVIDYWVPILLGARMDKFVNLVAQSAKLVLPRNKTLYIAA